jgi:hypothetical protein
MFEVIAVTIGSVAYVASIIGSFIFGAYCGKSSAVSQFKGYVSSIEPTPYGDSPNPAGFKAQN